LLQSFQGYSLSFPPALSSCFFSPTPFCCFLQFKLLAIHWTGERPPPRFSPGGCPIAAFSQPILRLHSNRCPPLFPPRDFTVHPKNRSLPLFPSRFSSSLCCSRLRWNPFPQSNSKIVRLPIRLTFLRRAPFPLGHPPRPPLQRHPPPPKDLVVTFRTVLRHRF